MSKPALDDLSRRVHELPWHHQIDFGNGIISPGNTKIPVLNAQANVYFKHGVLGKTVLDVGCWDGFNSFEAKKRGAARVLATDHFAWSNQCWGKRESFELARSNISPEVEVLDIDLPELNPDRVGQFDLVLFAGVFYHLRHPLLVLERIASLATECLIVETHLDALDEQRPAMIFYPGGELANDPTNWWGPNPKCVEAMMRDVGCSRVEYTQHPTEPNRGIFHGRK